jgi:putative hydrolase of the HAD superfamily
MTEEIKTIIFDFGNVVGLFNYAPTFRKLRSLTHLSEEEIRLALETSDLPDCFECGQVSAEQFLERVIALCQLPVACDRDLLTAAWSDIFTPNHDVCALIPRLKPRYRLLLGSNTNELHARQFRRQFADVLRHFDELVLSYEVGAMKPDPRFFQRCRELARCEAAQCVFIDDRADNIDGAGACGMQGIVYNDMAELRRTLAALGVES